MGTTQPIRNRKELQKFSTYYQTVKPHPRNYALIILGLNTALRISDLLQLQWSDVYDFYAQRFREHLLILEQKTESYCQHSQNRSSHCSFVFIEKRVLLFRKHSLLLVICSDDYL